MLIMLMKLTFRGGRGVIIKRLVAMVFSWDAAPVDVIECQSGTSVTPAALVQLEVAIALLGCSRLRRTWVKSSSIRCLFQSWMYGTVIFSCKILYGRLWLGNNLPQFGCRGQNLPKLGFKGQILGFEMKYFSLFCFFFRDQNFPNFEFLISKFVKIWV